MAGGAQSDEVFAEPVRVQCFQDGCRVGGGYAGAVIIDELIGGWDVDGQVDANDRGSGGGAG